MMSYADKDMWRPGIAMGIMFPIGWIPLLMIRARDRECYGEPSDYYRALSRWFKVGMLIDALFLVWMCLHV
jgi:hypothetical protein